MVLEVLDIAPWPREREQQQYKEQLKKEQEAAEQAQKQAEKEKEIIEQKTDKKSLKEKKKAEKLKKKAEKKAKKQQKKAEKKAQQSAKGLSSVNTVTTVEVPASPSSETAAAAMPTGIVLAGCASLLLCLGSALLYRRQVKG